MASEHANAQIRLIKGLIKEAIEEEYSILLERPERRSNLIEDDGVIEEGVFDDGVLKAVFTAGGPGSGKSFLADLIFGVRDAAGKPYFKNASFLGRTGLKYVNSDKFFEKQLKDNDIDAGDLQRIEKEEPELWDKIQGASPDSLRNIAKGKLKMLKGFFESGRIGMLIDGTGGNYEKMVRQKEAAEALGMIPCFSLLTPVKKLRLRDTQIVNASSQRKRLENCGVMSKIIKRASRIFSVTRWLLLTMINLVHHQRML